MMPSLLMLASGVGLVAAKRRSLGTGRRLADHRFFAGLISIAVTLSLFSIVAWAATAIAQVRTAPSRLGSCRHVRPSFRYDCINSYSSSRRANVAGPRMA